MASASALLGRPLTDPVDLGGSDRSTVLPATAECMRALLEATADWKHDPLPLYPAFGGLDSPVDQHARD